MKLTKTEIGYIAGIIDGDGWVGIRYEFRNNPKLKHKKVYYPQISVVNTNLQMLEWLMEKIGMGHICENSHYNTPQWKTAYDYRISAKSLRVLLPKIIPHLIIKKQNAILLLELIDIHKKNSHLGSNPMDEKDYTRMEEIYLQIKTLNKRGKTKGG